MWAVQRVVWLVQMLAWTSDDCLAQVSDGESVNVSDDRLAQVWVVHWVQCLAAALVPVLAEHLVPPSVGK